MQKLSFFLFLVFANFVSSAQELLLENLTVQDKWSKTVYIGVDNYFTIKTPNFVKAIVPQQGVVLKGDSLQVRAYTTGDLSVIFLTTEGRENVIFTVKTLSSPFPSINGWTDAFIEKSFLLNNGKLTIKTFRVDDTFLEGYQITSFEATINNETFHVNGNEFTEPILAAIRKAKKGDEFIINKYTAYNQTTNKGMRSSGIAYVINE